MPIDVEKVLGATLDPVEYSWDQDDVILYHLGIGAGADPTDATELTYVYENGLKVLPSFGVVPVFSSLIGFIALDGVDINPMMILHGEQDIELHAPLPIQATVTSQARVAEIWDKGKGALLVIEVETSDKTGSKLMTNRFNTFVRGEGGWGGESGPKPGHEAPDRDPDIRVERPTRPNQALLYRLSGDKNPLHADPQMAAAVGFERPILHGLCFYGITCKAIVDEMLDGDVLAVSRYQARFAGVVYPGETVVVEGWDEGDQILVRASTKERGEAVITNSAITKA